MNKRIIEMCGQERCDICGEPFTLRDEVAEFHAPSDEPMYVVEMTESKIAHAQCGLDAGMEIA